MTVRVSRSGRDRARPAARTGGALGLVGTPVTGREVGTFDFGAHC